MNILKKVNKKTTIIISLIVVAVALFGISIAYLSDSAGTLVNTFDAASIHTDIEEEVDGSLKKDVKVANNDKTDALVRVRLSISNEELFNQYFGLKDLGNNPWELKGEYYYYTEVLKSKTKTQSLFTRLLYKDGNEYKDFPFVEDSEGNYVLDSSATDRMKEALQILNSVEITVYQESVPVKFSYKDNGQTIQLNADQNGNGLIDTDEEKADAEKIWNYFESQK